jgi:hypothetical protein
LKRIERDTLSYNKFKNNPFIMQGVLNMYDRLPMEEEVMDMLIGGFSIIMVIAIITIISLWKKNRTQSAAFLWIFIHFIMLSIAVYFALRAISFDLNHPMASEEISILLGKAGVLWGMSMISLLFGISKFSKGIKQG